LRIDFIPNDAYKINKVLQFTGMIKTNFKTKKKGDKSDLIPTELHPEKWTA